MFFTSGVLFLILFYCLQGFLNYGNKTVSRRAILLTSILLSLFSGLRGEGVDNDYGAYLIYYDQPVVAVEPSFYIIRWFAQISGLGTIFLFICYAFLGVTIKVHAISKLTSLFWFSIAIYLSNIFLLHDVTQIRAGVSSAFILLMVKPIQERNFKKFIVYYVLASFFHFSALLSIVLYPLIHKKITSKSLIIWSLLPIFGYVLYFFMSNVNIFALIPFEDIRMKLEMYKNMQEMGAEGFSQINLFNLHAIFRLTIFYLLISKFNYLQQKNEYFAVLIKIYSIALMTFPLLGAITPLLGYRTSELFGVVEVILYPMLMYLFKPERLSLLLITFVALLLFFINIFYKQLIFL